MSRLSRPLPARPTRRLVALATLATTGLALTAHDTSSAQTKAVSGSITVLTNRTDIVDTVFAKQYVPRFQKKYPKVKVKFEALTDYEGETKIRMNTKDYGDVLLIPNSITPDKLPSYFEPLGTVAELSKKYRFVNEQAYKGKGYGIAVAGNASGFVYNRKVFAAAGITTTPKTPDEFVAALKAVKAKTKAVPLYTNYSAGWPVTKWEDFRGVPSGDQNAANKLATSDAPWAKGSEHEVIDSLLYAVAKEGLIEADPTTTDWEQSKTMLGKGDIATMPLGSWAIVQMQGAAANAADIGYLPFPLQVNGQFLSSAGGDYKIGVNKNSKNKAAAKAWLNWFTDESGFAADQGGIPALLNGKMPSQLEDFTKLNVKYVEQLPAPAGAEGLLQRIDAKAEIGFYEPKYRQRIIDAGRGATKESIDSIFSDLNDRWAKARANTK